MLLSRLRVSLLLALFASAAFAAPPLGQPHGRKILVLMGAKMENSASSESTGPSRAITKSQQPIPFGKSCLRVYRNFLRTNRNHKVHRSDSW
jgi:hypothetical protein